MFSSPLREIISGLADFSHIFRAFPSDGGLWSY
jgi:hypothetical protein